MIVQVWTNENSDDVINKHDYDIHVDYMNVMYRSGDSQWVNPGEMVGSIIDTGNDVRVKLGKKKITLNYCEVVELLALLLSSCNDRLELRDSKTIKSI